MKSKALSVGKVHFFNYQQAGRWYKSTACLVFWGGRYAGEYENYGDGEPGHMHIIDVPIWTALAAVFSGEDTLEAAILAEIALFETERKLRERVRRDGCLVWRIPYKNGFKYHAHSMNPCSGYVPDQLRDYHPDVEFYQYNNGSWRWVK